MTAMRALIFGLFLPFAAAAQVSVQEFPLPPGMGVHDVWADAAPGGPVWFSAQRSGQLGILDPKTGKVELVALGPGSSPHGVVAGPDGAPWLTDGGQNAIVRVDPKTKEVKRWPLPQSTGYANLNTAIFDGKSGAVKVIEPPTKGQGARRVWSDSKGNVWVAEWNSGQLSRYEPRSGKWAQWKAPGEAPRIYAVYVDETDKVWADRKSTRLNSSHSQ